MLNYGSGAEAMFADLGHFNKRSIQVISTADPSIEFFFERRSIGFRYRCQKTNPAQLYLKSFNACRSHIHRVGPTCVEQLRIHCVQIYARTFVFLTLLIYMTMVASAVGFLFVCLSSSDPHLCWRSGLFSSIPTSAQQCLLRLDS